MHEVKRPAIKHSARVRPDGYTLGVAALAVLGAAHILVRTSTYGAAVTGDAVTYLSAAESLAAGDGLRTYSGGLFVMYLPFFSMLMAFISLFGLEPAEAGRFVNVAAFGLIILISGLWLDRRLRARFLALAATVSMTTSLALSHVATTILTETIFVLFTLLTLICLESFLNRGNGMPALMGATVFAALAAVTRYMGVPLILAGAVMLLTRREISVRAKLKHAAVYGVLSLVPLAIVMAHNWVVSGRLTGYRKAIVSWQILSDSLSQTVDAFRLGVFPTAAPDWFGYLLLMLAGLVASGAALVFVMAGRGQTTSSSNPGEGASSFGVFSLVYLATSVVITPFMIASPRYLIPIYVPLLIVAVFLLDRFLHIDGSRRVLIVKRTLAAIMLTGWFANIGLAALTNLQLTARALESGYAGLNTARWEDSETIQYVKANLITDRVYSNYPDAVFYLATVPPPVKYIPSLATPGECGSWLWRIGESGDAYVVWLHKSRGWTHSEVVNRNRKESLGERCSIPELDPHPALKRVAETSDGAVYRVTMPYAPEGVTLTAEAPG